MSSSPLFLDACVAMYAAGHDHRYREPCARIVIAVSEARLAAATDAEVIQEIAYRYYALHRRAEGLRMAEAFLETVGRVLPVTQKDIVRSLELLHAHSFLLPRDAIHIAVMEAAGLTKIVTADRHFERVPGIQRVDPAEVTW